MRSPDVDHAGLAAVIDAAAGVLAARSLEDTLRAMARALHTVVPYTSLAIYEVLPGADVLLPVLAAGSHVDQTLSDRPPLDASVAGRAIAGQELICINPGDPLFAGGDHIPGTPVDEPEALVVAPLIAHGQPLGALNVWREGPNPAFSPCDADLIRRFATLAAMAWDGARQRELLRRQARTDELTGLHNRRDFHERLQQELDRVARDHAPVALVLLDIDDFKRINDDYGHIAGDEVLRAFAGVLHTQVRSVDDTFRTGGEEFAAVLPGADTAEAQRVAQRLVRAVREGGLHPSGGSLTASAGVASAPGDAVMLEALYHAADVRLLEAKATGKDRAVGPLGSGASRESAA